ncbi:YncE family protein [Kitasatospora sp. NPDC004240]
MRDDLLAVACLGSRSVVLLAADDYRTLGEVALPPEPHELVLDPARRLLYCTVTYRDGIYERHGERATELVVIDPDARKVVDTLDLSPEHAPHGLALDPVRDLLYVSVEAGPAGGGGVLVIDLATREVVDRIATGAPGPHWFAITPDGGTGYAANKEAGFVTVVDLVGRRASGLVEVPGSEGLAPTPDGRWVVVATPKLALGGPLAAPPALTVIDTASGEVARTLPLEAPALAVHLTATGLLLAAEVHLAPSAPDGGLPVPVNGRLRIFAPGPVPGGFEPLASVEVGHIPLTVHSSPDGRLGYVSNTASDTLTVVDLVRHEVVTEVRVGGDADAGPHGIVHVPARP